MAKTILEFEKEFKTKNACALALDCSIIQLRRYEILKAIVHDQTVYIPTANKRRDSKRNQLLNGENK